MRDLMRPEHRVFYDMLDGQGDWVLIEPYGYVFRPDVNFVAWRPYSNGYWRRATTGAGSGCPPTTSAGRPITTAAG